MCPAAERYVAGLVHVLGAVETGLSSLTMGADTRRYVVEQKPSKSDTAAAAAAAAEDDLDVRKVLTGFHMADRNSRFRCALAKLRVQHVSLHFDFSESYFDFVVRKDVLCEQRFADLAGQVMVKRMDVRRDVALRGLDKEQAGVWEERVPVEIQTWELSTKRV